MKKTKQTNTPLINWLGNDWKLLTCKSLRADAEDSV